MFSELPLHERLQKALTEIQFTEPTEVQKETIPVALKGRDMVVAAETGSGKTAAFMVPILHQLMEKPCPNSGARSLILVPTRELAKQVQKVTRQLASFSNVTSEIIIGGDDFKYQRAALRKNPEILIATPGRLLEHLQRRSTDLDDLEHLVLDEADRMLDLGFQEEVGAILDDANPERQTLLLSATLNHKGVKLFLPFLKYPETVTLTSGREAHESITHQVILSDDPQHKQTQLTWLLANQPHSKALVFCNTRDQVMRLRYLLQKHNLKADALHGEMDQSARNKVTDLFRRDQLEVLVATDVAARGLDIKGVDLVINFDLARNGDDYTHRVGRTGRAGETGVAISLIGPNEWNLKESIARYLNLEFEHRSIKAIAGKYKGPSKKSGSKKKPGFKGKKGPGKNKEDAKAKQRHRDRKNVGKRRKPSAPSLGDGSAPIKKKR